MATLTKPQTEAPVKKTRSEVPAAQPRSEQVSLRVPPSTKRILQQGAAIAGQSLTDFLVTTSAEKARQLVAQNRVITMSQVAFDEFAAALDQPARPITPLAAEVFDDFLGTIRADGTFDW
jgi:uncharacterized protein (DUF1778 family)